MECLGNWFIDFSTLPSAHNFLLGNSPSITLATLKMIWKRIKLKRCQIPNVFIEFQHMLDILEVKPEHPSTKSTENQPSRGLKNALRKCKRSNVLRRILKRIRNLNP